MEHSGFKDLKLSREMQKAITDMGFEEATPIQSQSIPFMLEGKDVIGQAQTGTGKTAAFGIAAIERIDPKNLAVQAVILCPTRELAIQVSEELKKLSKYKRGIEILPVYGGQPIDRQIRALKKGVQIIIGTPGRVMDHMERRTLKLDSVKMIVLDEADEMLDMGFREDIELIMTKVQKERQTILFSATMSRAILDLTKRYQTKPQMIKLENKEMTVPKVEQFYYEVKSQLKPEVLSRLIDINDIKLSLVFCNTKRLVDELVDNLKSRGYLADGLHGDLQQRQRDIVMSKFRKKEIEILVATDVAARGIDVGDIEAVFNYDIPPDDEYYVHRIGRTARAGKPGRAFSFVTGREVYRIRQIQQFTKSKIIAQKIPTVSDIEEIKTNLILEKVKGVVDAGHLGEYTNMVEKLTQDDYTSLEIAAALLKMQMGERAKEEPIKKKRNDRNNYY
jgi:ATP-dependent RNA helicase DeaD